MGLRNISYSPSMALLAALLLTACGGGNSSTSAVPSSAFQAASVVVGQVDFIVGGSNQSDLVDDFMHPLRSGSVDANTIHSPFGNPGVNNGVLYLPDYFNNRLLGYDTIPTVNGLDADFVLGQPDFTSSGRGTGVNEFDGPKAVFFDQNQMFLVGLHNHRILIWNGYPTSGNVPADYVVGQPHMESFEKGCSPSKLYFPEGGWAVDGKLIVTDSGNNRVLIWNTVPTSNGTPASVVLGQQNFFNCAANDHNQDGFSDFSAIPTASTLNYPAGVWSDGTRLVVLDRNNNRVLIWNSFPTTHFEPADVVLGQASFEKNAPDDDDQNGFPDPNTSARTLDRPYGGVYSNGQQLFVADSNNNRVLVWNSFPTTHFAPADAVLGQSSFTNSIANDDNQDNVSDVSPTARTLDFPTGIFQVGNRLIVADKDNHRYLIYDWQQ